MAKFRQFLGTHKRYLFPSAFGMILIGVILIWFGLLRPVTVVVDGTAQTAQTRAIRVAGVLRSADVPLAPEDIIRPPKTKLLWNQPIIEVTTAREVVLQAPDFEVRFQSAERIPANLLQLAEIQLFPQDRVLVNGAVIESTSPHTPNGDFVLQFQPAIPLTVIEEDQQRTIFTDQPTLGAALEAGSVSLAPVDRASHPLDTPLEQALTVTIRRAKPVTVAVDGTTVTGLSAALTVGEALQDVGLPLQLLDSSQPAENAPLPSDRLLTVSRAREDVSIITEEVQYQNDYIEDPDTPLDQVAVIEPGQLGITATRERVRKVDGEEVWRDVDGPWQASETKNGVLGVGTRVVIQTEVVDGETLEFFRKLTVWTTSYKPCDAAGNCHYGTSSGLPVQKGVIGVRHSWYLGMQGQRVFVPGYGYGVIADVCGGCVGKPWIDLGYSEEEYPLLASGNRWVTIYLLTPVPAYIPVPFP